MLLDDLCHKEIEKSKFIELIINELDNSSAYETIDALISKTQEEIFRITSEDITNYNKSSNEEKSLSVDELNWFYFVDENNIPYFSFNLNVDEYFNYTTCDGQLELGMPGYFYNADICIHSLVIANFYTNLDIRYSNQNLTQRVIQVLGAKLSSREKAILTLATDLDFVRG